VRMPFHRCVCCVLKILFVCTWPPPRPPGAAANQFLHELRDTLNNAQTFELIPNEAARSIGETLFCFSNFLRESEYRVLFILFLFLHNNHSKCFHLMSTVQILCVSVVLIDC